MSATTGKILISLLSLMFVFSVSFGAAGSTKSKAELKLAKKARQEEKLKDKREAAEKAKRENREKAAAKAKAKKTADFERRLKKDKTLIDSLQFPEDTSALVDVKAIQIIGNILVTTDRIFSKMPLVFSSSDKSVTQAASENLYDFRSIHETILYPDKAVKVSARTIKGFTQYILSLYQEQNFAGIYVYVPSEVMQEGAQLKDGVLVIEVIEAPASDVTVRTFDPNQNRREKPYLSHSAIMDWSPVKPGEVANQKELDDFVNLLNQNPDRYVSAVVKRGAQPRSLALGYDVYEVSPWHFFIQADNSGTKDRQWTPRVGIVNTNLLGIDDTLTAVYQAPWDKDIEDEYSIYGSYDFPLMGPKLRLNVYAGYNQFDISEGGNMTFLGNGSFYGGILRYNVCQADGWFLDVTGTMSYERSKITASLAGYGFPISDVEMYLWGYGVELHRSDDMSNTSLGFNQVQLFDGSDQSDFTTARSGSERDFIIYTTSASHSQFIDPNKVQRLSGSFRWITSNDRLVPAKMTTFGGLYTVRGYDENAIVADGGILASAQYEFDLVKHAEAQEAKLPKPERVKTEKPLFKKVAPLLFYDYGLAKVIDPRSTEDGTEVLSAIGAGVLVEIGDNFSGGVYYGYPLCKTDDTDRGESKWSITLLLRW